MNPSKHPITKEPTEKPTIQPITQKPTKKPSMNPTRHPITTEPSEKPTTQPTTQKPTKIPSKIPTQSPVTTEIPTYLLSVNPTKALACGNDRCEDGESSFSCPVDCSNVILEAHPEGKSGAPGVMFDLTASRDVIVRSFGFYTDAIRNDVVEVYTRPGSYSGYEGDEAGWILIHSKSVDQMGRNVLTELGDFDTDVTIKEGATQAFFITSNYYLMYDKGTAEGHVLNSDGSLSIYEGEYIDIAHLELYFLKYHSSHTI